jgi:hypothetical protein
MLRVWKVLLHAWHSVNFNCIISLNLKQLFISTYDNKYTEIKINKK